MGSPATGFGQRPDSGLSATTRSGPPLGVPTLTPPLPERLWERSCPASTWREADPSPSGVFLFSGVLRMSDSNQERDERREKPRCRHFRGDRPNSDSESARPEVAGTHQRPVVSNHANALLGPSLLPPAMLEAAAPGGAHCLPQSGSGWALSSRWRETSQCGNTLGGRGQGRGRGRT